MAAPRICSVDGCNKAAWRRGWCGAHYARFRRHGDPLGGGTGWGIPLQWLKEQIAAAGTDCIFWTFADNTGGRGVLRYNGRNIEAHRLVCILVHGEPPTPEHEAAHSCGNGHLGCINPNHLRWDTRVGNFAD